MLTMQVSGAIRGAKRGAIAVRLCAFNVKSTTSAAAAFAGSSVAETGASKFPISPRTRTPCSCIARRCAPRAIKVTSSPDFASMAPTKAPMAPAPTMANFMTTQECFIQMETEVANAGVGDDHPKSYACMGLTRYEHHRNARYRDPPTASIKISPASPANGRLLANGEFITETVSRILARRCRHQQILSLR